MTAGLYRYWLEFRAPPRPEFTLGAGVTAWTADDARNLIGDAVGRSGATIEISNLVEDVDIRSLDQAHVVPNIGFSPSMRGIWFPQGYEEATQ